MTTAISVLVVTLVFSGVEISGWRIEIAKRRILYLKFSRVSNGGESKTLPGRGVHILLSLRLCVCGEEGGGYFTLS